ncbi:transmembrane protein 207 [Tupaia chinensis]|uniref:transmembrane protein 207 n=1 Tax=Tupaia chinensis TaxID=246437 RepID=UPI0003C8CFCC|nr:transmembrane protein 207 [Tupaia chinensis]
MSRFRLLRVTSVISTTGTFCLLLLQLVLSDLQCEENEMYVHYNDQHPNGWYIWFLLLIFSVALLCGVVLCCLQCWLNRRQADSPRRTVAIFTVGDLDPIYGTEAAVGPTVGIHPQTGNPDRCSGPRFGTVGPPPAYEEILKTSQF